jgi:hypothetical protein
MASGKTGVHGMNDTLSKGASPFYPSQPVPAELFRGRAEQIARILTRGVSQVEDGKPTCFFVQGEYGIGKSSLARFTQLVAEKTHKLLGIYTTLGGASTIDQVGEAILQATIESGTMAPNWSAKIQDWLAKYVGGQTLLGLSLRFDALKREGPSITKGVLPFLRDVLDRLRDEGAKGIFLVLDEVNGIAGNPQFAHFLKGIVDKNALSVQPIPLLLMLCGTEERRRQLIASHQPVERIFDVVEIERLTEPEMTDFFGSAFQKARMTVAPEAMVIMTENSAGFPKIMHLVGENAYWCDNDGDISASDATQAVFMAALDVGKKYVDQQIYRALQSNDYRSILRKLARAGMSPVFRKADLEKGLTDSEKRKLNIFLQRMKKLNVVRSGEVPGEYAFNMRMVQLYIWLREWTEK